MIVHAFSYLTETGSSYQAIRTRRLFQNPCTKQEGSNTGGGCEIQLMLKFGKDCRKQLLAYALRVELDYESKR